MAGHDVNTMVQVGPEPNVRGDPCGGPIEEGMDVRSIESARLPRQRQICEAFSRFLPVVYYKTFFRPNGWWKLFEKPIRELAGLGKLDPAAHHGYYDKVCDVLVVGAVAGLEAAIASAEASAIRC